ncbi:unnamed protein product [Phyllotreta striolata]|uniref:Uncharacterized protein n=1 Tax=Phyllotreta striolata TaxID=444603 RepID=A0A9N9TVZ1_PHYSR|nr:unnamed protein product [Phyllotreta striolata]
MKILAVFLVLFGCAFARKLPSFIEVCKPKEVDVSECITRNVENLRSKLALKEGIPQMGIPSINPLIIPIADLKIGDLHATLKNIKVWHVPEFVLENLKVDLGDSIRVELKVVFHKIFAEADYDIKGKILILNLDGSGPGQINVTELAATVVATGKKVIKNGKSFLSLDDFKIDPTIGRLDLKFENLFPNNQELSDNANKVLNDNQEVIVEEFAPLVIDIIKELISSIFKNIFRRYSYDVLFPSA